MLYTCIYTQLLSAAAESRRPPELGPSAIAPPALQPPNFFFFDIPIKAVRIRHTNCRSVQLVCKAARMQCTQFHASIKSKIYYSPSEYRNFSCYISTYGSPQVTTQKLAQLVRIYICTPDYYSVAKLVYLSVSCCQYRRVYCRL